MDPYVALCYVSTGYLHPEVNVTSRLGVNVSQRKGRPGSPQRFCLAPILIPSPAILVPTAIIVKLNKTQFSGNISPLSRSPSRQLRGLVILRLIVTLP